MNNFTIFLIGGGDDETATLTTEDRDDLCHISFRFRDRILEATADDYFEAFCEIRSELEQEGIIPFCYAASLNVFPSGMARTMGSGLRAYRLTSGRQALMKDLVDIFDSGPDVIPSSVVNQANFYNDWIKSL